MRHRLIRARGRSYGLIVPRFLRRMGTLNGKKPRLRNPQERARRLRPAPVFSLRDLAVADTPRDGERA